jgi:hypothetical protein
MKYPALQKVLSGRFKEEATAPFLLTYKSPKHGGSVEIELSAYIPWTSRMDMSRDPDSAAEIKKGLTKILSKQDLKSSLVGLEVDRIFQSLDWSIRPLDT